MLVFNLLSAFCIRQIILGNSPKFWNIYATIFCSGAPVFLFEIHTVIKTIEKKKKTVIEMIFQTRTYGHAAQCKNCKVKAQRTWTGPILHPRSSVRSRSERVNCDGTRRMSRTFGWSKSGYQYRVIGVNRRVQCHRPTFRRTLAQQWDNPFVRNRIDYARFTVTVSLILAVW